MPKIVKANCGIPTYVDGRIEYSGTHAVMADYARLAQASGARIIGGAGTTPAHIQAMAQALRDEVSGNLPSFKK